MALDTTPILGKGAVKDTYNLRDKANLVAESGDWLRRMQKSLDQMNVRVHRAVSDIDGATGMAILRAIAGGERDAQKLAKLRDRRCSKTEQEIAEQFFAALSGERCASCIAIVRVLGDHCQCID